VAVSANGEAFLETKEGRLEEAEAEVERMTVQTKAMIAARICSVLVPVIAY